MNFLTGRSLIIFSTCLTCPFSLHLSYTNSHSHTSPHLLFFSLFYSRPTLSPSLFALFIPSPAAFSFPPHCPHRTSLIVAGFTAIYYPFLPRAFNRVQLSLMTESDSLTQSTKRSKSSHQAIKHLHPPPLSSFSSASASSSSSSSVPQSVSTSIS